eukprot:TRINITY_DN7145_c0_g1_i1.p1 TRINITY_DN7145_c0_g1~~TRINITY_DN7145_c0_g1_i1.p1  ORF type:complete len:247 (-),score=54.49 TRINITY_DN7145_c0_g1_i1:201-941(-)
MECTDFMELHRCLSKEMALTTNWDLLISTIYGIGFPSFQNVIDLRGKVFLEVKEQTDKSAILRLPQNVRARLSLKELEIMRENFNKVSVHGVVTKEQFSKLFESQLGELSKDLVMRDLIYSLFDTDGDSNIDWKEYCIALSFLANGTTAEKIEFWFKTFDVDGSGLIEFSELASLFRWKLAVLGHPHDSKTIQHTVQKAWDGAINKRSHMSGIKIDPNSGEDHPGLNREEFQLVCLGHNLLCPLVR